MEQQILDLFKTRDRAVTEKNKELFLSTQLNEIGKSNSQGYLELSKLTSQVLNVHKDDEAWVVFVKEEYRRDDETSRKGFLIYKIIQENEKPIIVDIRY